ncbi:MAG: hypothetical protein WCJ30_04830 [Deltaproteobacteria bacterium]
MISSPRRRLVLAAVLLAAVSGIGCSTVEPLEADVQNAGACALLRPYQPPPPAAARFYRYWSNVDFGRPPPSSVSTRGGSATQTYLTRDIITRRVDGEFHSATLMMVLSVVLLIAAAFLAVLTIAALGGTLPRKRKLALAGATLGLVVLAGITGYLGGSIWVIDNPGAVDLEVLFDGESIHVPPQSFVEMRLGGGSRDAEVRAGGQVVERVALDPDDGVGDVTRRALFGRGGFIYTVCGLNRYYLRTANYRRR